MRYLIDLQDHERAGGGLMLWWGAGTEFGGGEEGKEATIVREERCIPQRNASLHVQTLHCKRDYHHS